MRGLAPFLGDKLSEIKLPIKFNAMYTTQIDLGIQFIFNEKLFATWCMKGSFQKSLLIKVGCPKKCWKTVLKVSQVHINNDT